MKKTRTGDMEANLSRFSFHYRITPHTTTGVSPAELLFKRKPRSHMDELKPNIATRVQINQTRQKSGHDVRTRNRQFNIDDRVFVRNFATSGNTWLPGVIIESRGELTFFVELQDGRVFRRHIDHIRRCSCPVDGSDTSVETDDILPPTTANSASSSTDESSHQSDILRRSTRVRNPPDRLM